jgi:hypothetical protein
VSVGVHNPQKQKYINHYTNDVPMAGVTNPDGTYTSGIEDFLLASGQYRTKNIKNGGSGHHRQLVVSISHNTQISWLIRHIQYSGSG